MLAQENFKSTEAKVAKAKYEQSVANLKEEYEKRISELQMQCKSDLLNARKKALEKGELDESQKILEVEKAVEVEKEITFFPDARETISKRLLNTTWVNEKDSWFFRSTTTVEITTGGKNYWVPLDDYRIAILYKNGAVDICKFDSSFKAFEYFLGVRPDAGPISKAIIRR